MAPMKRPAASSSASAKRQRGPKQELASISKVVKSAEDFPEAVRAMLCENMELSLGLCKEERHDFQVQVVEMIQKVVMSVETSMQGRVQAAQTESENSEAEKAKRESEMKAASEAVTAKSEAQAAAQVAADEADAVSKAAATALEVAEKEQKVGDKEIEAAVAKKANLDSIMTTYFEKLKNKSLQPSEVPGAVNSVVKLAKDLDFDPALLTSMPSALSKDERGTFDQLVMSQVDEAMKIQSQALEAEINRLKPASAERAQKVTSCKTELSSKQEAAKVAADSFAVAKTEYKEAVSTEKAKKKLVKDYASDMKKVKADLAQLTSDMEELKSGAIADLKALAEKSIHPPEPTEEVLAEKSINPPEPTEVAA